MVIKDKELGNFDVYLGDDGTMDTVIEVNHNNQSHDIRYSDTSWYRRPDGSFYNNRFRMLAHDAVDAYIDTYLI